MKKEKMKKFKKIREGWNSTDSSFLIFWVLLFCSSMYFITVFYPTKWCVLFSIPIFLSGFMSIVGFLVLFWSKVYWEELK